MIKLRLMKSRLRLRRGRPSSRRLNLRGSGFPPSATTEGSFPLGLAASVSFSRKESPSFCRRASPPQETGWRSRLNLQKFLNRDGCSSSSFCSTIRMICPRCEKEGECDLQNLIYEYGVEETRYPWEPVRSPADDRSLLLQRDSDKCILCGQCARICDEVQGVGELSFTRRGIKTAIDTDFHRPMECEFCGQCMDTCPVGAITSDRFDYAAKSWELKETTTPCPLLRLRLPSHHRLEGSRSQKGLLRSCQRPKRRKPLRQGKVRLGLRRSS